MKKLIKTYHPNFLVGVPTLFEVFMKNKIFQAILKVTIIVLLFNLILSKTKMNTKSL